jgi:hypothetical protein
MYQMLYGLSHTLPILKMRRLREMFLVNRLPGRV